MKRNFSIICLLMLLGCQSIAHQKKVDLPELPSIPDSALGGNAVVVEFWPNGQLKSERVYQDGKLTEGVFFASDGTVILEMHSRESDSAEE